MVYTKQEKKEEGEVQNTLTIKSGGEKVSTFKNMNFKLISKIWKLSLICVMHLP